MIKKDEAKRLVELLLNMKAEGASKQVMLQALRGFNEGGQILPIGARVKVDSRRAKRMVNTGYAREVGDDEPYEYPAENVKHKFQRVELEETMEKAGADYNEAGDLHEIDFLTEYMVDALKAKGIFSIACLEDWTVDTLSAIKGIGKKTAEKLMRAYEAEYGNYSGTQHVGGTTK